MAVYEISGGRRRRRRKRSIREDALLRENSWEISHFGCKIFKLLFPI
jgi:hypothetical protein